MSIGYTDKIKSPSAIKRSDAEKAARKVVPPCRTNQGGITLPMFSIQQPALKKSEAPAKKELQQLPPGDYYPPDNIPRDGTHIIVRRRPKPPPMKNQDVEAYWTVPKGRSVGYWATLRSSGLKEEDIIGWRPK